MRKSRNSNSSVPPSSNGISRLDRRRLEQPGANQEDASRLEALKETIDQLPDIDATRVVDLHNRIAAGEYQIELERLAHKLLDLEQQLKS